MAAGVIRQANVTGNRVARVLRGLRFGEAAQSAALALLAGTQWPTADRLPRQHAALQSFEHSGRAPLLAAWLPRPSELADRLPVKL
jgi:hypothetical protein